MARILIKDFRWNAGNFLVMALLLFPTLLLLNFSLRRVRKPLSYVLGFLILVGFLLVWAELGGGHSGHTFGR